MAATVRSISRAANPLRNAAFKVAIDAKASLARPSFRLPKSPAATATRSLRSPLEMSFGVESFMPMHSATASALMNSLIAVSRPGYGWMTEASHEDV
ncbi:hypothetical protein ZOSMA_29G00090 [Zostera marina]|uniref:Protein NUCLEAR FUSION DEFECTIVE 6, chloroplastic/mitochondrial-like n=1 Tax=Zostera marina TaxID=29655 RepID=A0A0K9PBL8_ZOSMR|nr:hypothetical protein ZOSMA_29G00090 [Zostera marina]